jgi:FtsP/CotA-like multicopper oxidase with cupredoxin domain
MYGSLPLLPAALRPIARGLHASLAVAGLMCLVAVNCLATPLNPYSLTKYIDPLPLPGAMPMDSPGHYEIGMYKVFQKFHASLPPGACYAYGTSQQTASYPALTLVATRGVPFQVHWTNHLPPVHIEQAVVDSTLPGAYFEDQSIPVVPHIHGGETEPESDGTPFQFFTSDFTHKGSSWAHETFTYHNTQPGATLWYHDHAFGYTRMNAYVGLAGYYVVLDPANDPVGLPSGAYDVPLCLQDKMLDDDGSIIYPNMGINSEHPYWGPEFFGDLIMVNGKVWPYLDIEARKYRFRVLNGSQARFFSLHLEDQATGAAGPMFYQIGTDGGYLPCATILNNPNNPNSKPLLVAPGERCDIIVDFSGVAPGTNMILVNDANTPYPSGDPVDPATTRQVIQFRVHAATSPDLSVIATHNTIPELVPTRRRQVTLVEHQGTNGPLAMYIDGREFTDPSDLIAPRLGETELWEIVNLTADTHPMHTHLVQFLPFSRQAFNVMDYENDFMTQNPTIPIPNGSPYNVVPIGSYLQGLPMKPDANERGWKDTFRADPGTVSRLLVRFAPQDGGAFPFDASGQPYVFHCHILEHEENDMMRDYQVLPAGVLGPSVLTPADMPVENPSDEFFCSNPTPVQLALVSSEAIGDAINLNWYSPDGGSVVATLYRRTADSDWARLATVMSDGTGHISYVDHDAMPGRSYGYRLGVTQGTGAEQFLGEAWVAMPIMARLMLDRPSPNPMRGSGSLNFSLTREGRINLSIFDTSGRRVRDLAQGVYPAGPHSQVWDGRDAAGKPVGDGIYFIRLEAEGKVFTQRVATLR